MGWVKRYEIINDSVHGVIVCGCLAMWWRQGWVSQLGWFDSFWPMMLKKNVKLSSTEACASFHLSCLPTVILDVTYLYGCVIRRSRNPGSLSHSLDESLHRPQLNLEWMANNLCWVKPLRFGILFSISGGSILSLLIHYLKFEPL